MNEFEKFIDLCLLQKKALIEQDDSLAESSTDELMKIRKELYNEGVILSLSDLFTHDEDWVKYHAAFWLLPTNEKESLKILKKIKKGKDSVLNDKIEFVTEYWKMGALNWLESY